MFGGKGLLTFLLLCLTIPLIFTFMPVSDYADDQEVSPIVKRSMRLLYDPPIAFSGIDTNSEEREDITHYYRLRSKSNVRERDHDAKASHMQRLKQKQQQSNPIPFANGDSYSDTEKDKRKMKIKKKPKDKPKKIKKDEEKAKDEEKEKKEEDKKLSQKLNPKPPLDLPIVKPEVQILENEPAAKLILTKDKPFHFHVPLVSKKPEKKLTMDELMVLAKKYKDPLTLDPIVYKAAASGTILTEDQLKTIKRMARDSPVLDFLNFASNISTDDLENLMGAKRSFVNIVPTDELLQELVGDDDDLIAFVGMTSQEAKTNTLNALRRSGLPSQDDFASDLVALESSVRRKRVLSNADFYRFDREDLDYPLQEIHHRSKRGLGNWFKKMFGKKTTTTTSTTSTTPTPITTKKSRSSSSSSSSEESKRKKKKKKAEKRLKKKINKIVLELKYDDEGNIKPEIVEVAKRRSKRGLGRWLKKIFGKKEPTTIPATTTTKAPQKPYDDDSDSEEKKRMKKNKKKKKKSKIIFKVVYDQDGDTEVDLLLPKELRRSTWLKKNKNNKYENGVGGSEDGKKKREEENKEPRR